MLELRLEFQVSIPLKLCDAMLTIDHCECPSTILADRIVRHQENGLAEGADDLVTLGRELIELRIAMEKEVCKPPP